MRVYVRDIEWDLDGATEDQLEEARETLPVDSWAEVGSLEEVADVLSDEFGWCVKDFEVDHIEYTHVEIVERVRNVLRRYFERDDSGNENKDYDDGMSAQDAVDEIHQIVGEI